MDARKKSSKGLRNLDTVLFLGVREQLNNPVFSSIEFAGIGNEAVVNVLEGTKPAFDNRRVKYH